MARSYRTKGKKHPQAETVESFGYLDELKNKYDDPISHFEEYVAAKNLELTLESAEYVISAKRNQRLVENTSSRRNYGYIAIMKLYYELGLDRFLLNRQRRGSKIEFNTSSVMKLLVIERILSPGSKKRAFERRGRYFDFENEDAFGLQDVYRSLSFYAMLEKDIQLLIHDRITKSYGRKLDIIYYDVTNYYFEIDIEDDLRRKGVSKEHRPNPIVQLGLAMDAEGLPISYEVFAGNESEKLHLRPMVFNLRDKYDSGRVIAIADSAQNTGNNVYYLDSGNQGYIFSQTVHGGTKALKEYVADDSGYVWYGDEYKRKSRVERREIQVDFERKDGTTHKKKMLVDQRQIVFYSEKYAARSKAQREAAVMKARKIIENPSAYTRATSHGALKYIMNVEVDKETGEVKAAAKGTPCFDNDVLMEEEKYDGYYCIVTNVFDEGEDKDKFDDAQIIDLYRGLWRIEESFGITKDELETRPVFVSTPDHIKAHFLICYIALVIVRLIQKRTGYECSPEVLIEAMNMIACSHEGGNLYLFDYRSDAGDLLGKAFSLDFSMLRLTRAEIKKNIGAVKRS
jgi:transposase